MIELIENPLVTDSYQIELAFSYQRSVIGSASKIAGAFMFEANYTFPEYLVTASELRSIADKLDQLNKGYVLSATHALIN